MHEHDAFAQRHANMVGEFQRRGPGAAFLAVHHDEVRHDTGIQHCLGNGHEFPRVTQAELEPDRLALGQFAQALDELQQFDGCGKGRVPRRRDAVPVLGNAAGRGNLGTDLVFGQDSTMARFGALAQFDLDHLHLGPACLDGEAFGIECTVLVSAAKIATAQLPDQVPAVFQVVRADAALPGVMGEVAQLRALVQRRNGIGAQGAEAHRGNIQHRRRIRLAALRAADRHAKFVRVAMHHRQHRMTDELEPGVIDVLQRTERGIGGLVLGPGIDQRALRPGKGQLLVVTLDQVLADLRTDAFHQIADVAQNRIVAPHGVAGLQQVEYAQQTERSGDQGNGPQPTGSEQERQTEEGEQHAQGEEGVATRQWQFHSDSRGQTSQGV